MSLYENKTYENLMEDALNRADTSYDKRPGSMIWNGNAPCLAEVAQLYAAMEFVFDATYILTAPREYLIKRASDRSITPTPATHATYVAEFTRMDGSAVPRGTRFSCEDLNFVVINWPKTDPDTGKVIEDPDDGNLTETKPFDEAGETQYRPAQLLKCETAGTAGNGYWGLDLTPIEYVQGLAPSVLGYPITEAEDEEETEAFRARVIEAMRSIAFGGNRADYREKVLAIDGIGQCKVYPHWNDDLSPAILNPDDAQLIADARTAISGIFDDDVKDYLTALVDASESQKLAVGGTVKVVVMSTNLLSPEVNDVSAVKQVLDPVDGEGLGLAPIGHVVNVSSVSPKSISVDLTVTKKAGVEDAEIEAAVQEAIYALQEELCADWSKSNSIVVYHAFVQYTIMKAISSMIDNLTALTLNDGSSDITMTADEYPAFGTPTVTCN